MIYLILTGRLGNQMFQYAFARKLHIERKCKDGFCFSFKDILARKDEGKGFEDTLQFFNVLPYRTCNKNLIKEFGTPYQKFLYGLNKLKKGIISDNIFRKNGIILSNYCNDNISHIENIFLRGKFENPLCFKDICDELRHEFTPKEPPINGNKELYQIIENSNSICVSIRRGDYLSINNKNDFYLCDEAYFNKAISYMKEHVSNPVFIFFSDDINWVRNNIQINDIEAYYESGEDPVWEKLRLMYSCKNFIISNSTFSWWAQFLSQNNNKVVVSPSRWFANNNWKSFLLDDSFIKIDV